MKFLIDLIVLSVFLMACIFPLLICAKYVHMGPCLYHLT